MSFSGIVLIAGGAAAMNVAAVYHQDRDPFPTALAGGILLTTLAFIDEGAPELADGLASIFLLASLFSYDHRDKQGRSVSRGEWLVSWVTSLTTPTTDSGGGSF